MTGLVRFQRRRVAGWTTPYPKGTYRMVNRLGPNRPGPWGNPFAVGRPATVGIPDTGGELLRVAHVADAAAAVGWYAELLTRAPVLVEQVRAGLAGLHLGCFCTPGGPCHGDLQLQVANCAREQVADFLNQARHILPD